MKIQGFNFVSAISTDGGETLKKIGAARTCELTASCDMIECASLSSKWREFLPGRNDWSVQVDCLYDTTGNDAIESYLASQTPLWGAFCVNKAQGTINYVGKMYCTQWTITGTIEGRMTASCVFRGSGPLSRDEQEVTTRLPTLSDVDRIASDDKGDITPVVPGDGSIKLPTN